MGNEVASGELRELAYDSAARLAVSDVLTVEPATTAAQLRRRMVGRRYATVTDVAVCEGSALRGLIRVEDALSAPDETPAAALMDDDPPTVGPGVDQEVVAWKAVQHGEGAVAVADEEGRFIGLIPPHRLLGVLLAEHDEDLVRLGGFLKGSETARLTSLEPVHRRLFHRLPWLLLGLVGALLAALIVDAFEASLRETVLIAAFIPGIVYLADAVGTQTEALVIRGMSVGVSIKQVVARELTTGLLAGAALAAAFLPVGILFWGDTSVALVVSLALFAACSVATVVAMLLPWLMGAAGTDPAFGSGPLGTVVQDLLSILIYLGLASLIV
jgi:magnesium transporter